MSRAGHYIQEDAAPDIIAAIRTFAQYWRSPSYYWR
jgi:hypothetical protein